MECLIKSEQEDRVESKKRLKTEQEFHGYSTNSLLFLLAVRFQITSDNTSEDHEFSLIILVYNQIK